MPLSVILLTKNSAKDLPECLKSVQSMAPQLVVVDDQSTDASVEIARSFGANVRTRALDGFGKQKQFALDLTETDWVFLIDSDEKVTPELAQEIQQILNRPAYNAYRVARKNYYFGQWLKHGGKFPDYQVRLLKKQKCRFSDDAVHEKIIAEGAVGTLNYALEHHSYPNTEVWFKKLELFARFRAKELARKNIFPSAFNAFKYCFYRPFTRFLRRYVFKLGFLDGLPGFWACLHDTLTEIISYLIFIQERPIRP